MLRGAPISDEERKEVNLEASRLFENCEIAMFDYDVLREYDYAGYAEHYLQKSWNESELKNKADVIIYKKLLEIDSKLGTTKSEQLLKCVFYSLRIDLIEVWIYFGVFET